MSVPFVTVPVTLRSPSQTAVVASPADLVVPAYIRTFACVASSETDERDVPSPLRVISIGTTRPPPQNMSLPAASAQPTGSSTSARPPESENVSTLLIA